MLTRVVKLTFQEQHLADFFAHFEKVKHDVAHFQGCLGMKLLTDLNEPNVIFTYSEWENEAALDNYRHSELFLSIWPQIKPWFAQRAEAWSLQENFNGFIR
ncbi:MAG: putative quinol monooxygenase [Flavobacteriales bacterium]